METSPLGILVQMDFSPASLSSSARRRCGATPPSLVKLKGVAGPQCEQHPFQLDHVVTHGRNGDLFVGMTARSHCVAQLVHCPAGVAGADGRTATKGTHAANSE